MFDRATLERAVDLQARSYQLQLLRRLEGRSAGPATLALWRGFAWKPEGSPKKGYQLSADQILEAERTVRVRLSELCKSSAG